MQPVEIALLFNGKPDPVFDHLAGALNARLEPQGLAVEEISPTVPALAAFRGGGMVLEIILSPRPLPADSFAGALDSPISRPFRGPLGETLSRHAAHMLIRLRRDTPPAPPPRGSGRQVDTAQATQAKATALQAPPPQATDALTGLRLAHATAALLAQQLNPAAVHWRASNQMLTGAQYAGLWDDPTPWVLLARARLVAEPDGGAGAPRRTLVLEGCESLVGRRIVFAGTDLPADEIHAAALSFLRHALETGEPVPHGHSFGPAGGETYRVTHVAPGDIHPHGAFELSAAASDAGTTPGESARSPGVNLFPFDPLVDADDDRPRHDRARSLAIGYLMLVLLPPVGALLMLSNAIFGSNGWRTGVLATAALGMAMILGAYTFLNIEGGETRLYSEAGTAALMRAR